MTDQWKTIEVNEHFDALITALDRAERKGYMPEAMAEEWEAFQFREPTGTAPEAVKGDGFDSSCGGFTHILIGDKRYTAAEVRAALRSQGGGTP